ncbi:MFS transporter [Mycobacterium sp. Lab-001]|uniref:MFS transporter n=1 Tax=Mycobacterium sp. Lab-001 TaxID=3410136 RepID=UPI003D174920
MASNPGRRTLPDLRGSANQHPGMANYPADGGDHRRAHRPTPMPSANRYLPPLSERSESGRKSSTPRGPAPAERITVTRAAAQRSREMGSRMYSMVQRAATADGADKSGLTALTWPVVANFAVDAAMAVALANTLFFAAATGESKGRVALYLLITIAPFAVIAPLIGPALDRLQHGRRVALATSFALRTGLAALLIMNYDGPTGSYPSWVLYPCALAMMVLSKSFSVLRSAVTPRVMPPSIDLVRVNSRLTVFGLLGGTIAGGAIAAGVEFVCTHLFKLPGALFVVTAATITGAMLSMRIPRWVEVTAGEVPATLSYRTDSGPLRRWGHLPRVGDWPEEVKKVSGTLRQPLGRNIITSLWGNCTVKVMVGFLFLYPAFVAKAHQANGWAQLGMLGMIGAAAGIGNFAGNFASARLQLGRPAVLVVRCAVAVCTVALAAAVAGNLTVAVIATLVTSGSSAIAKASLDASLQNDLPEESRASGFGRSESTLQLAWVLGGALGVLVYTDWWIGFTAVCALLILGLAQTLVSFRGDSLIPGLGGNRPVMVEQEGRRRGAGRPAAVRE